MIKDLRYLELCYLRSEVALELSKDISMIILGYEHIMPSHIWLVACVTDWYYAQNTVFTLRFKRLKKLRAIRAAWEKHIVAVPKLERVLLNWPLEYI